MSISEQVRPVSDEDVGTRVAFLKRTYMHLGAALLTFVLMEGYLLSTQFAVQFVDFAYGGRFNWLLVLGCFTAVGWMADSLARSDQSPLLQYLGLGLYVLAEAVLFLPLLVFAAYISSPTIIPTAGLVTIITFGGLTAFVFISRADFSFLRMALIGLTFLALGLIVVALLIGIDFGVWFAFAMIGLACGYILYYTSNILHHYQHDQHVAAALALFASLALLFWYVLQIFIGADDD